MIKKLTLLVGVGAGYVLGSKAGRQRYDGIVAQVQKLTGTPQAQKVSDTLHQAAGDLADKATTAAVTATESVKDKAATSQDPIDLTQPPITAKAAKKPAVTTSAAPMAGAAPSTTAPDTL